MQVSAKTNSEAGDGTTTSTILAQNSYDRLISTSRVVLVLSKSNVFREVL